MNSKPSGLDPEKAEAMKGAPYLSVKQMQKQLFKDMARMLQTPDIVESINAHAAEILDRPWAKRVLPVTERLAVHIESDAGMAKTASVKQMAEKFARVAGLNFVHNPAIDYIPSKQDLYFFTSNMIGQFNTSEVGGLPTVLEVGAKGESKFTLIDELKARIDAGLLMLSKQKVSVKDNVREFKQGGLDGFSLEIENVSTQAGMKALIDAQMHWLTSVLKGSDAKLTILRDGDEARDGDFSIRVKQTEKGATFEYFEPSKKLMSMGIKAMGKLMNLSWEKASRAGACIMFIDEIDKISPAIRHLLLEIAQFGRVSGTADLGENYMVVMAGNMGARENFNDYNDSLSQPTVAEKTRVKTYRAHITPDELAEYIELCYPGTDGAFFPTFLRTHGSQPGMMTPDYNGDIGGNPVATPRSVKNACDYVLAHFSEADEAGVSRDEVMKDVHIDVESIAGTQFAHAVTAFMANMNNLARPIAQHIVNSDSEKLEKMNAKALSFPQAHGKNLIDLILEKTNNFAMHDPEVTTFIAGLKDSLVSETISRVMRADNEKQEIQSMANFFAGIGILHRPEIINSAVSRFHERMCDLPGFDRQKFMENIVPAINKGLASGAYGDQGMSKEELKEYLDEVRNNIRTCITGINWDELSKEKMKKQS